MDSKNHFNSVVARFFRLITVGYFNPNWLAIWRGVKRSFNNDSSILENLLVFSEVIVQYMEKKPPPGLLTNPEGGLLLFIYTFFARFAVYHTTIHVTH